MNRIIILVAVLLCPFAHADNLRMSVGVTRYSSESLELAYSIRKKWDIALGYVGSQTLDANIHTNTCKDPSLKPPCDHVVLTGEMELNSYYYASFQRIHEFRRDRTIRPFAGIGLAAYTDTNPLISSPLGFSLSAGMNIGERFDVQWRHFSNAGFEKPNMGQDMLLAGWRL
jgi:hypothetical protein